MHCIYQLVNIYNSDIMVTTKWEKILLTTILLYLKKYLQDNWNDLYATKKCRKEPETPRTAWNSGAL